MRNGQKSARDTLEMDRKVRAVPQKWTDKCARSCRKVLFSLGNGRIFASTKAHHPSQGDWWWAVRRWERRHHQPLIKPCERVGVQRPVMRSSSPPAMACLPACQSTETTR